MTPRSLRSLLFAAAARVTLLSAFRLKPELEGGPRAAFFSLRFRNDTPGWRTNSEIENPVALQKIICQRQNRDGAMTALHSVFASGL